MRVEQSLVWRKRLHWEKYLRPQSVAEAIGLLEKHRGEAKIIAGGTDVILQIRKGEIEPKVLVDITRIPGLNEIRMEDGQIKIGALVTHTQVALSPLIRGKALALSEGASWLGSPQIRNLGTLAGNIVSGQPGADTTIPLLALEANVRVADRQGERVVPMTEFFLGTGKTVVDGGREMVTEIFFTPLATGEASVSLRLARRKALALPILTVAIVMSADTKQKKFGGVRIALGPVATTPFRARQAEGMLTGASISEGIVKEAARAAAKESNPRSSLVRGSEAYRREMVANLVERGIHKGLERLEGKHA